jgi:hypothetical protein
MAEQSKVRIVEFSLHLSVRGSFKPAANARCRHGRKEALRELYDSSACFWVKNFRSPARSRRQRSGRLSLQQLPSTHPPAHLHMAFAEVRARTLSPGAHEIVIQSGADN